MSLIELVHLVCGDADGKCLLLPVDHVVGLSEPGESKDDVLLSAVHYVKENHMGNSSNMGIENCGKMDIATFLGV